MKKNDIKKELEQVEKMIKELEKVKEVFTEKPLTKTKIKELKRIAKGKAQIIRTTNTVEKVLNEEESTKVTTTKTRYKKVAQLILNANNINY